MLYHSTNNPSFRVGLKEAILRSLPPDNGLYMPDRLPVLGDDFWKIWRHLSFTETQILSALQEAQQRHLDVVRQLADLIQEQGSAMRRFDEPHAFGVCAGECAFAVTE